MDFLFGKSRQNNNKNIKIDAGLEFDGFKLIRKIGTGGMGEVWLAKQMSMDRDVAIKLLSPKYSMDTSFIERFMQEVRTTALLSHPNIVQAYHAGNYHGLYYLAVAFIDGVNLGDRLQIDNIIAEVEALKIMRSVAEALRYAWNEHKLMHRDLKPGNIMIDFSGKVLLMDFGISKSLHDADSMMTMNNAIVGTPYYMSPEQARSPKDLDCRADIYSFGATLFHLVVGDLPFHADSTVAVLTKLITEELPPARSLNPNVSERMEMFLNMLMKKDRNDRVSSWEEVIDNVDRLLTGQPMHFNPASAQDSEPEEEDAPDQTIVINFDEPAPQPRTIQQTQLDSMQDLHKENLILDKDHEGEVIVGIDLGTTFSAISWVNPNGNVEVLPNSDGYATTPSVLFFDGDDVVLVGREAVQSSLLEPENTAECFKRNIGEESFTHEILGRKWHPEFLSAFVLKKLKQDAEEKIGPVRNAVITVPAYFDDSRRKATQDAGIAAGLNVVDIINEPSAAALWYGYKHTMQKGKYPTFLIYDLGGGTFDATLMHVNDNFEFVTIATDGDVSLGGKDWDRRLLDYVAQEVKAETGIDPRDDAIALQELSQSVEQSKRALSKRNSVNIPITIGGQNVRIKVDRQKFKDITADLLLRTETTVELLLEEAELEMEDLESVIAVGGSSRMPMVREMLEELSGKEVDTSLDADLAVVQGAAVYAAALRAKGANGKDYYSHEVCHKLSEMKHCDVNSHSLGVETEDDDGSPMNYIIIPRNTSIPCEESAVFGTVSSADDETRSIMINILEGESTNPEACVQIGTCFIHDLPPDLPAGSPVEVVFSYLENGRIEVSAKAVDVGVEVNAQIVRGNNMVTSDQVDEFKQHLAGIEVV